MKFFGMRSSKKQTECTVASDELRSAILKLKHILALLDASDELVAAAHLQAAIDALEYTLQELGEKKI